MRLYTDFLSVFECEVYIIFVVESCAGNYLTPKGSIEFLYKVSSGEGGKKGFYCYLA